MATLLILSLRQFLLVIIFTYMFHAATTVTCSPYRDITINPLSLRKKHTWVGPVGRRVITVDVNGGGDFQSVQDAVNAVPDNNRMNVFIQISAGYYMYSIHI